MSFSDAFGSPHLPGPAESGRESHTGSGKKHKKKKHHKKRQYEDEVDSDHHPQDDDHQPPEASPFPQEPSQSPKMSPQSELVDSSSRKTSHRQSPRPHDVTPDAQNTAAEEKVDFDQLDSGPNTPTKREVTFASRDSVDWPPAARGNGDSGGLPSFTKAEKTPEDTQMAPPSTNAQRRKRKSSVSGIGECGTYWYDVMTRYGNISPEDALIYATRFDDENLPFPSPDAHSYLTHEFLKSLGVESAGDRCRLLLACRRMPDLKRRENDADDENDQATDDDRMRRKSIDLEGTMFQGKPPPDETSYEPDTTKVSLRKYAPPNQSFQWIDLVGKDVMEEPKELISTKKLREMGNAFDVWRAPTSGNTSTRTGPSSGASSVNQPRAPNLTTPVDKAPPRSPGPSSLGLNIIEKEKERRASFRDSKRLSTAEGLTPEPQASRAFSTLTNVASSHHTQSMRDNAPHGPEFEMGLSEILHTIDDLDDRNAMSANGDDDESLLVDLLNTKLPLPQLRVDRSNPSKCCFVLRVCTLDVEDEDDTMRSLTNRWTIYIDAANQLVVTIHRVDSVALATLRDVFESGVPNGTTFKEFVGKILERFVLEYEKALDASEDWLDNCEAGMLSHNGNGMNPDDLLTNLFHLQRRASVYDRMVILSRSLIQREISRHLNLGDSIDPLDSRFQQLQEKTVDLGSRAQNLLEIHLSLTGYHTNELMKMLTKFSMFFTPITFLAGVWGMNFETMPELKWANGYYICLSVMVFIALCMLVWFRWANI